MMIFRETCCAGPKFEKLRIEDAQPREWLVGELMRDIQRGTPWTKLDTDGVTVGSVLTIWDDYDHRYIYRVTDYESLTDRYLLEWPD